MTDPVREIIRPGRDTDAAEVIALITRCWADYPPYAPDLDGTERGLLAPAAHYAARDGVLWVAEAAGAVVGMVAAVPHGDDGWEVCRMYVHPSRHGAGLAHRLLDVAEAHALAAGAARLVLWTDTQFDRAHRFYERRSYVRAGPIRVLPEDPGILEFGYAKPVQGVMVLDAAGAASAVRRMADILVACVDQGANVSLLAPLAPAEAEAVMRAAASGAAQGRCVLVAAWDRGVLAGTVRLQLDTPPNARHRAEVAGLLVHPDHRRRGLARRLMAALEAEAIKAGRTLLVLDTDPDSLAATMYARMGWMRAGVIPEYARDAAGKPVGTEYFWKAVAGA